MSTITENNQIIDDSSTEKTKGVGITNLSAGHKRNELNTFTILHKLFHRNNLTKEEFIKNLNEIHFYGTIPEKTAYWNSYETKEEEMSRKTNMKLFVDTEKAVAKAEAKAIAKAEAKASAPKKTKKSTKKGEEAAAESGSDHEKEEIALAVPVPEPVKVEVAAPVAAPVAIHEKVEDASTTDSKKKKKNAKKESHTDA
jgi:hypothetical protein